MELRLTSTSAPVCSLSLCARPSRDLAIEIAQRGGAGRGLVQVRRCT